MHNSSAADMFNLRRNMAGGITTTESHYHHDPTLDEVWSRTKHGRPSDPHLLNISPKSQNRLVTLASAKRAVTHHTDR